MLYGVYPIEDLKKKVLLKPVMSVKVRIIFVQTIAKGRGISYGHTFKAKEDITVAILPIGYSNGYLRSLSNKAFVLVAGVRCPVVGRVTMDQIIVDITAVTLSGHIPAIGEEAVLMGSQKGSSVTADELALWADTISYEILCSLGNRLPRIYHYLPPLPVAGPAG
jgi:alanine racemase